MNHIHVHAWEAGGPYARGLALRRHGPLPKKECLGTSTGNREETTDDTSQGKITKITDHRSQMT